MIYRVLLTRRARKGLRKAPRHVVTKLLGWVDLVRARGLEEARRIPGYHDEPLRGQRKGQRSIRLSRAYRAIYTMDRDGTIEFVRIEEVSKHEY